MVYSRLRVLPHWVSAAVIIWTLVSGFYVANFETTAPIASCVFLALLVLLPIGAVIIHEARGHRVLRRMSWNSRARDLDNSSEL
jgi:cytochrome b561